MSDNITPFERDVELDKPAIIGARWWHKSLSNPMPRRAAIAALLAGGAALSVGIVWAISTSSSSSSSSVDFQARPSLDMQKEFGWSFGAVTEGLVFNGVALQPFDPATLPHLADDLAPASSRLAPFYVPTLFQSPSATPRSVPSGDPGTITPLSQAVRPITSPAMDLAYKRGRALAALVAKSDSSIAIIADLPGEEAVALAAGAAGSLDPVFLLDNWPHPRGVVESHMTLGAAEYYQPLFAKAKSARAVGAPPIYVIDRRRLAPYSDDASQFDNRYVARLPTLKNLVALGVKTVVYIAPSAADVELDDLNDQLVDAHAALDLRIFPVSSIDSALYLGDPFSPIARATAFSTGHGGSPLQAPRPVGFGTVPIAVAIGTGIILGAKLSRSGSWNRSSSGSGG